LSPPRDQIDVVCPVGSGPEEDRHHDEDTTDSWPKKAVPNRHEVGSRGTSKKDAVLALIARKPRRDAGRDHDRAAGWQKHTFRGFIGIIGKGGAKIERAKGEAVARTNKAT
jgi:hypothetical protein